MSTATAQATTSDLAARAATIREARWHGGPTEQAAREGRLAGIQTATHLLHSNIHAAEFDDVMALAEKAAGSVRPHSAAYGQAFLEAVAATIALAE